MVLKKLQSQDSWIWGGRITWQKITVRRSVDQSDADAAAEREA